MRVTKFNKRWLSWLLLATIFATACWFLSQWQFARQREVSQANSVISKNYDAQPVPLTDLLAQKQTWDRTLEYRPVSVVGHYLPESTLLVRNRPYDGNPGFLELVAFKIDSGEIIWVERGWLPTGSKADKPDSIPQVDSQRRKIFLRLRPNEAALNRTAPRGQLPNIDLPLATKKINQSQTYLQAYGRLISEENPLGRGVDLGRPELSEGNHLSYALQWIVFALMAFGAVAWNINQDRRVRSGLDPLKLKALNQDKDAQAEDQLLDEGN